MNQCKEILGGEYSYFLSLLFSEMNRCWDFSLLKHTIIALKYSNIHYVYNIVKKWSVFIMIAEMEGLWKVMEVLLLGSTMTTFHEESAAITQQGKSQQAITDFFYKR